MPENATSATNTGGSTGASSTPNSGSASSSPPTLKVGMGPQGADSPKPASGANGRLTPEQLFKDYGEDIFKHERITELSGYKKQWDDVAPLVQEFGSVEGLMKFKEHLGPVWQALLTSDPARANAVWEKLYPVFMAIANNQDVDRFFAKVQAEVNATSPTGDDDDPVVKKVGEIEKNFNDFKTQTEQEKAIERQNKAKEVATRNFNTYEDRFQEKAKAAGMPAEVLTELGDIMVTRIVKYMPKDPRTQKPLNPLYNYNEKAFDECFEKEILPFFKKLSQNGVESAVRKTTETPTVPNSHSSGSTPVGTGVPPNRAAKAARLTQFINTGR